MTEFRLAVFGGILAFLFGAIDMAYLPRSRSLVESMKVVVAPQGLCFCFGPEPTEVIYPWRGLAVSDVQRSQGGVTSL
jgi:hypothetical protein